MVRNIALTLAITVAVPAAAAQDDLRALAERAKVNAAQYHGEAEHRAGGAQASSAPTEAELAELVRDAKANARSLVGEELYDNLPERLAAGREQYGAEIARFEEQARDSVLRGIELARELAGSQMQAVEKQQANEVWRNPRFRLFVSQSMPDAEVKALLDLARNDPSMVVVVRGLKPDQHVTALQEWVGRLLKPIKAGEEVPAVTMDPEPFNELGVDQVPVLAEYTRSGELVAFVQGVTSKEWLTAKSAGGARGNLGVHGPTVPVAEVDILEVIQKRVREFDWNKAKEGALDRFWAKVPAHDLPRVSTERMRMLDPTFEVAQTLTAPDGTVVAQAGERLNPLEAIPAPMTLLFFDPADPDQVQWVRRTVAKYPGRPVTVMASQLRTLDGLEGLAKLTEQLGVRVFSLPDDVRETFHIERVPTLVTSRDLKFQIHEQVP